MSNSSRINKATNELDKAEKRLLYSFGLTEGNSDQTDPNIKFANLNLLVA